ncbi:unnamed protein product, partial [Symbiodinium pilosum]
GPGPMDSTAHASKGAQDLREKEVAKNGKTVDGTIEDSQTSDAWQGEKAARDVDYTDTSSEEDDGISNALPIEEIPEEIEIEDDAGGYGSRSLNPDAFRPTSRAGASSSTDKE